MSITSKSILVVVVSLLAVISSVFYKDFIENYDAKSFIVTNADTTSIVVLHDDNTRLNLSQIHQLDEDHFFLMLKKDKTLYLFTTLDQLRPYDHDNDHVIDNSDPVFNHLYIGQYDKQNKRLVYHPIQQTAIRAIRLDTNANNQVVQGQTIYTGNHQDRSVMGMYLSARAFPKEAFSHLKLIPRANLPRTKTS